MTIIPKLYLSNIDVEYSYVVIKLLVVLYPIVLGIYCYHHNVHNVYYGQTSRHFTMSAGLLYLPYSSHKAYKAFQNIKCSI